MNEPARKENDKPPATPLELMTRRSKTMLLAERLLRLAAALATLGLAFLALSWSGLWLEIGAPWRIVGVALFAQAALFLLVREILRGPPVGARRCGGSTRRTPAVCAPLLRWRISSPAKRPIPRRRRCGKRIAVGWSEPSRR